MKRAFALLALTSLTACSYFGSDDELVTASEPEANTQVAAAAEPAGVKSITPPQSASTLAIANAWALISPKGAKVAAGYFIVANGGIESDRLISANSPRAARTEIHEIVLEGSVAKMRPVAGGIEVPPGGSAVLKEDGLHVMFVDVDTPFTEGETIPVTLTFEKAGNVDVTMKVRRGGQNVARH